MTCKYAANCDGYRKDAFTCGCYDAETGGTPFGPHCGKFRSFEKLEARLSKSRSTRFRWEFIRAKT